MHHFQHFSGPLTSLISVSMKQVVLATDPAATAGVGQPSAAAESSASFSFCVVLGVTYGIMHVIGPDHLGTLMALSVASTPRRAFTVGALWSLGHCLGMVIVAFVLLILQRLIQVNTEAWEYVGDYVIGFSLIVCGMYFIVREDQYLQEQADGSAKLKSCECCSHVPAGYSTGLGAATTQPFPATEAAVAVTVKRGPRKQGKLRPCDSFSARRCCDHDHSPGGSHCCSGDSSTDAESGQGTDDSLERYAERKLHSCYDHGEDLKESIAAYNYAASVLGVFQGLCCPMGLVGITFMASLPATGVLTFLVSFLLVSALGTGTVASFWAMLSRNEGCTTLSSTMMYRVSCYFTVLLGVAWVIANACGVLDSLNYAEAHAPSPLVAQINSKMPP